MKSVVKLWGEEGGGEMGVNGVLTSCFLPCGDQWETLCDEALEPAEKEGTLNYVNWSLGIGGPRERGKHLNDLL